MYLRTNNYSNSGDLLQIAVVNILMQSPGTIQKHLPTNDLRIKFTCKWDTDYILNIISLCHTQVTRIPTANHQISTFSKLSLKKIDGKKLVLKVSFE